MATKLLITGDWHFRGNNPRARIDDFPAALKTKLREVFYTAWLRRCDAVIVPGDVFDSPNTSLGVIAELAHLLQEEAQMPILAVPGNHDEFGSNPETISRTPYGLLERLGFIYDVSRRPWMPEKVTVVGSGFSADTDRDVSQYLWADMGEPEGTIRIMVAHGMLLERTPSFELRHTLISDVAAHPNAPDVLICGHEHTGFGVLRVPRPGKAEPMLAINPGALCRLTARPAEIERQVQMCLLTIDDNGQVEAELIPVMSARPGHEALSREHLEAQAAKEERVAAFLALLAEEGEARVLSVVEIITSIAERDKLPPEVKDEALHRLSKAREEIGSLAA